MMGNGRRSGGRDSCGFDSFFFLIGSQAATEQVVSSKTTSSGSRMAVGVAAVAGAEAGSAAEAASGTYLALDLRLGLLHRP